MPYVPCSQRTPQKLALFYIYAIIPNKDYPTLHKFSSLKQSEAVYPPKSKPLTLSVYMDGSASNNHLRTSGGLCYNRNMAEHELQNAIIDYLKAIKCYPIRINSGKIQNMLTGSWTQLAPPGTPDCITSLPDGSWGCIEVKSKSGSLSMDQITTLRNIASKGLKWLVADDIDDLVKWLANPEYHGKERHIKALNERFAYSEVPKSKRMTTNMWLDMELHARRVDNGK